jgi:DNA-binding MarR family transcriptional regulator
MEDRTLAEDGRDDGRLASFLRDWRAMRPDLEPVGFSIVMHIRRLNLLMVKVLDEIAAEFDLGDSDVRLMMAIKRDRAGKAVRPSELSDRLGLTRATITYRVDRLLDDGLAERVADPSDRRALFVQLTQKGELVLTQVMTRFAAVTNDKLAGVDRMPGGRKALEDRLKAMVAEFEKAGAPPG